MRTKENLSPNEESIKVDWLAGSKSIRQIAKDHEVSEAWVRKLAKKHRWGPRPKPGAQASAQGRALVVPAPIKSTEPPPVASDAVRAEPKSNIDIAAEVDPEELAKEGLIVLKMLLAEIKAEGVQIGWLETVIDEETAGDKTPRRYLALQKAVSAPVRALATKNIMLAMQTASAVGPGKKQQAKDKAAALGTGRFATPPAPPAFTSSRMQ